MTTPSDRGILHLADLDTDGHDTVAGVSTLAAADVTVADTGNNFTGTTAEAVLAELFGLIGGGGFDDTSLAAYLAAAAIVLEATESVTLRAGQGAAAADGHAISLVAGLGDAGTGGAYGEIGINGGKASGDGGSIGVNAGSAASGAGGAAIDLTGGIEAAGDGGDIYLNPGASGGGRAGLVFIEPLPTSDPNVEGALWDDDGTLRLSSAESSSIATFTPTWTGATTDPAIGNGTLTGHYQRIAPKLYWFSVAITMGSTTTFGSGNWIIGNLPFTVRSTAPVEQLASVLCVDTGSASYAGVARLPAGATAIGAATADAGTQYVSAAVPHAWASTDVFVIEGIVASD